MKVLWKVLLGLGALLGGLFAVYYYNLDMKLVRGAVIPLLNRHYDSRRIEHEI